MEVLLIRPGGAHIGVYPGLPSSKGGMVWAMK
jgi:hypothetical protein